jgi:hypothetical protein
MSFINDNNPLAIIHRNWNCLMVQSVGAVSPVVESFWGNNVTALGGVVDGIMPGEMPVTEKTEFLSYLSGAFVETFESRVYEQQTVNNLIINDLFYAGSGIQWVISDRNITPSDRARISVNTWGGPPGIPGASGFLGRFSTTGNPSSATTLNGDTNYAGGKWSETNYKKVTVDFGVNDVSAFGCYITDSGDYNGTLDVDITSGGVSLPGFPQNLITESLIPSTNGGLAFFGYINQTQSFDKVVFTITQNSEVAPDEFDIVGFDDLIFALA